MTGRTLRGALYPLTGGLTLLLLAGCASKMEAPPAAAGAPAAVAARQTHYATPRALVDALIAACRTQNTAALVGAVGVANRALVESGDADADRAQCQRFVAAADTMTRLDPAGPHRLVLVVGSDDYPVPVPLVKDLQGWRLDTTAGAAEILRRTVGANELRAIATCRAAAQGAMLPASAGGYAYRSLGGPDARLVAVPLEYRRSGVMTFLLAANGRLYQKDLGAQSTQLAGALTGATPTAGWTVVTD